MSEDFTHNLSREMGFGCFGCSLGKAHIQESHTNQGLTHNKVHSFGASCVDNVMGNGFMVQSVKQGIGVANGLGHDRKVGSVHKSKQQVK